MPRQPVVTELNQQLLFTFNDLGYAIGYTIGIIVAKIMAINESAQRGT